MKNRMISILVIFIFIFSVSGCSCEKEINRGAIQIPMVEAYKKKDKDSNPTLVYPFNTMISVNYFYKEDKEKIEEYVVDEYTRLHILFDRHYYYYDEQGNLINNLKVINESNGEPVSVDQDLIDIFKTGIRFTKYSKGKFNIAVGNLSSLWDGFINIGNINKALDVSTIGTYTYEDGEYKISTHGDYIYNNANDVYVYVGEDRYTCDGVSCVLDENGTYVYLENIAPTSEQIEHAKKCTPSYENIENYIVVNDENNTITINPMSQCKTSISVTLGALGKSYATEKIAQNSTIKNGDFMLNAGQSTIKILGKNLSRETGEWNVGVTDSYLVYSRGNNFASYLMKIGDPLSISTSSGDEKHYFSNGHYYHHIIDPISGYPNQNRLAVTAVMENAMYADIITTSLMSMNINETKEYLKTLKDNGIEVELFIQDKAANNPRLYATSKLKEKISIRESDTLYEYLDSLVIEEFKYDA